METGGFGYIRGDGRTSFLKGTEGKLVARLATRDVHVIVTIRTRSGDEAGAGAGWKTNTNDIGRKEREFPQEETRGVGK